MKIVQALGWYFPNNLGGTEIYVEGLCKRLKAAGHTIKVAVPEPGARDVRCYEHNAIPIWRYPVPALPTRNECQQMCPVRGAEKFHAWLKAEKADVVHFHTFVTGLGLYEVKAAKGSGARVIVTTHASSLGYVCQRGTMMRWGAHPCDGICEVMKCAACELQHRGLPVPLARLISLTPPSVARLLLTAPGRSGTALGMSYLIAHNQVKQKEMLEHVDKFVVLTQWAYDVVLRNGAPPNKITLNRLGLSHEHVVKKSPPTLKPTERPVKVGYLGRYEFVKGVRHLAEAIALLEPELPIQFEFRGPVQSDLDRRMVDELRKVTATGPLTRFLPAVPPADVPTILAGYDVLCCPSICLEGGPTVAIEAHAVGTPVIGSRIGGLAELVTDGVNGRLVSPGNPAALAELFREIAQNPHETIDHWRFAIPPARTMDDVAADYNVLYA